MPFPVVPVTIILIGTICSAPPTLRLYGKICRKIKKGCSILSTKLQIKRFIKKTYTSNSKEDCIICFDDYSENKRCAKLYCGHKFHKKCIVRWMNEKKICPLCNTGFVLKSGKRYNENKKDPFYSQLEEN